MPSSLLQRRCSATKCMTVEDKARGWMRTSKKERHHQIEYHQIIFLASSQVAVQPFLNTLKLRRIGHRIHDFLQQAQRDLWSKVCCHYWFVLCLSEYVWSRSFVSRSKHLCLEDSVNTSTISTFHGTDTENEVLLLLLLLLFLKSFQFITKTFFLKH